MPQRQKVQQARRIVGNVSVFEHHGAWWIYYSENGKPVRRRAGANVHLAECEASLVNASLAAATAGVALETIPAFDALGLRPSVTSNSAVDHPKPTSKTTVPELRQTFVAHHRNVLHSSLATVARYTTATLYLEQFAAQRGIADPSALSVAEFIEHLRTIEVAPNGHVKSARRRLRDKGVLYILETCRGLYHFGTRKGLLPRDLLNPFTEMRLGSFRIRDSKPIFVFSESQEIAFFEKAKWWAFALHFVLAKSGTRPGELAHTLIEDVDLDAGWLTICSKPELGWTTKTNRQRRVPLSAEVVAVLKQVIGGRHAGPLFLRERADLSRILSGNRAKLAQLAAERLAERRRDIGRALSREEESKILRRVWVDAGAVLVDRIRTSYIAVAKTAGLDTTCPKSWRHTFATVCQQANVDLLVRQETMGHQPASAYSSALGMTAVYTHSTPDFQKSEIDRALRQRAAVLQLALGRVALESERTEPSARNSSPPRAQTN